MKRIPPPELKVEPLRSYYQIIAKGVTLLNCTRTVMWSTIWLLQGLANQIKVRIDTSHSYVCTV